MSLATLFALALQAAAGPVPSETTVIVTGRGLASSKGDAAYDVVAIDRQRIQDSASGRLEDVLRDVAGLQGFRRSDSRSANATSQSITLRGLGGNASSRALLILDGVPQTDPFGGWISFPAYSTGRIGSIRVTRGGGSALFGPGAVAGTVELDSAGPSDLGPIDAEASLGSRDSVDAHATVLLGDRRNFISLSGAFARGDGFIPIVAEDRGPIDRPAPYRQWSGAARGVVALTPTVELQANLLSFNDRRDRGLPNTANRGKGTDGSIRLVGRGALGWSALLYRQDHKFSSQSASVNDARTTATLVNDQYRVPSQSLGGRAEIVPLSGSAELRLGADFRRVRGEADELFQFLAGNPTRRREAGGQSLTAGAFADATLNRGPLTMNLSARLDRWKIGDGRLFEEMLSGGTLTDRRYADRDGWQPTGRVGVAWRGDGGLTLRGAFYRGWRLPTLNELYRPFRAGADATAANALLRPETSIGGEVGAGLRLHSNLDAALTLFAVDLRHAIANVTVAQGPGIFPGVGFVSAAGSYRRRDNLDRIRSRGVEFDLHGRAGAFDGRLSYAYVDATVDASGLGAPVDGLTPAQVPRHFVSATLGWTGPRALRLSLTARAVSGQFEDDLNQRRLKSAVTLDGYAAVPLTRRLALEARAENIFDRTVETTLSADGIVERSLPRTLWLGLRIR